MVVVGARLAGVVRCVMRKDPSRIACSMQVARLLAPPLETPSVLEGLRRCRERVIWVGTAEVLTIVVHILPLYF